MQQRMDQMKDTTITPMSTNMVSKGTIPYLDTEAIAKSATQGDKQLDLVLARLNATKDEAGTSDSSYYSDPEEDRKEFTYYMTTS